ncbi:pteridine reductase [Chromatiaceae bacterium AAb-1]|nr:pteridine reductase [Chromatiaceae bacterium AAb-1]
METSSFPVAFITGGARRLGKCIAITLHQAGYNLVIHYHHSAADAMQLADTLNKIRAGSVKLVSADLLDENSYQTIAQQVTACFNRLDLLVNNASSFYPTPLNTANQDHWHDLFGTNVKAPYFLSQAFATRLNHHKGAIINMVDIHAERPLQQHSIYCMAKAALLMMTKALAQELAPSVRVNGIAPGAILWPSQQSLPDADKHSILQQIPLQRLGEPEDIARTALFLAQAPYITGQIIAVDGGRSLGASSKA